MAMKAQRYDAVDPEGRDISPEVDPVNRHWKIVPNIDWPCKSLYWLRRNYIFWI